MYTILIVDQDYDYFTKLLNDCIGLEFKLIYAFDPIEAIVVLNENNVDIVICEYTFDSITGLKFKEIISKLNYKMPILMNTFNLESTNIIQTIKLGFSEYISKHYDSAVLIEYIRKNTANIVFSDDNILKSEQEAIELNESSRIVTKNDEQIQLTNKECCILSYFLRNKNRVISRTEFLKSHWNNLSYEVEERVVDTQVKILRKKLGIKSIISIHGKGYRWFE